MFNLYKGYRAAIFLILTVLGGISLNALGDIKVLAQTSSNVSCSNTEIEKHIKQLENAEPEAFDALVACNSKSVSALIKALEGKDEKIRIVAIVALGEIGENAKPAVPGLINALQDKDSMVRYSAAYTLGKIGKKAKPAVSELVAALQDKDSTVRSSAADALVRIGYKKASLCKHLLTEKIFITSITSSTIQETADGGYRIYCTGSRRRIGEFRNNCRVRRRCRTPYGIRKTIVIHNNTKPLVICSIPVINNILWKCPNNSSDKKPNNQKPQTGRRQQNPQTPQQRTR